MQLFERIEAFRRLGDYTGSISPADKSALTEYVQKENPWFTPVNVNRALEGITKLLDPSVLKEVTHHWQEPTSPATVGVAMAGNIPGVGFHDYLSILLAGHHVKAKPSSQDKALISHLHHKLVEIEPRFAPRVAFAENLKSVDAIIATGSDNTSRYFEYYFRNIPHLIRKNRASCAVIQGDEAPEEWPLLAHDAFAYFGMGCRNVSKLFVPSDFGFDELIHGLQSFQDIGHHHKYANNYDYQKSLLLLNQQKFLDGNFFLLVENPALVSPIGVIFFERYADQEDLSQKLAAQKDKLQVIVSAKGWLKGSIPFGQAQLPRYDDYADGMNVLDFLSRLK